MKLWTLQRVAFTPHETFGAMLRADGFPVCVTLEDPWRFNEVGRSCVPEGCYSAFPYTSADHGDTWGLQEVHGRSGIILHAGNTERHTRGCILLGSRFGERSELDILDSQDAMERFRAEQPRDEPFWLRVRDPRG